MLARKMKEIKKSVKRVYTRFIVLTAVIVFGAIAIAQGHKERVDASPSCAAAHVGRYR